MPRSSGKGYRQRPLRRYGFFIAVAGLVALLLLQTSPRLSEGVEPIRTAASDQLFHVTRPSLIDRLSGASAKERQILELEARVRELAQYKALALTMAERLEVYEEILNMQGEPGGAEVTARIMAETNGPFAEALLANAGATNSVAEGYYAENDRGLVGRVVQVEWIEGDHVWWPRRVGPSDRSTGAGRIPAKRTHFDVWRGRIVSSRRRCWPCARRR